VASAAHPSLSGVRAAATHPNRPLERSISVRLLASWKGSSAGFDFTPVLVAFVFVFLIVGTIQFLSVLPGGERGLLEFERACRLRSIGG
jgi:hypothetical protein